MISEDDFEEISGLEPELAFVRLERKFRDALNAKLQDADNNNAYNSFIIEYMNHTIAAAGALDLDILKNWKIPSHATSKHLADIFHDFTTEVDHYKVQIQILHIRTPQRYAVALTASEKEKLRHYVAQIKTVIDNSSLSNDKKEELYNKINAFLAEVDRNRTRFEVYSDLAIAVARTGGEMAKELEPVTRLINAIARLLGASKQIENERISQFEKKKLEPPKRQLPAPTKPDRDDLDDEIPF